MTKHKVVEGDLVTAAYEALLAEHDGQVGPQLLLDAARDPASPFHDFFEWDNDEAGERYRLAQASALLRRWKGTIVRLYGEDKKVSVSVVRRVESPEGQRTKGGASYRRVEDILADDALREDLLQTVLKQLMAYRKRYARLQELAEVWYAIDMLAESHAPAAAEEQPEVRV